VSLYLSAGLIFLGFVLGPFLGIIVDRAVKREPLVLEHRCPNCKNSLGILSVIPFIHWFQKCDTCSDSRIYRYIFVDLLASLLFVLMGYKFGFESVLIPYLLIAAVFTVLVVIDFETHLLPNIIVWPSVWCSLVLLAVFSYLIVDDYKFANALAGALIYSGFLFVSFLLYPKGMGLGDVKLALLLGAYIGWLEPNISEVLINVLYALLISTASGGFLGLAYNYIMKRGRAEIPFGPFLVAGTVLVILIS